MKIPEVQQFEDPQSERDEAPARSLRMASRNAGAALLGIAVAGISFWMKVHRHGDGGATYWWMWVAVAALVLLIAFSHALLAREFGARRAATFLKIVGVAILVGMLLGLRWY